jgi:hypothetical protein
MHHHPIISMLGHWTWISNHYGESQNRCHNTLWYSFM